MLALQRMSASHDNLTSGGVLQTQGGVVIRYTALLHLLGSSASCLVISPSCMACSYSGLPTMP